ncbi:MAG: AarF/UbiB family protein [Crenarchaeota archaeon]|nr:AarF/UbiB family protein [Thermoproteota archaeon]MCR8454773.1 AarF/UbiB family protein [Thermoproteota archaeon]
MLRQKHVKALKLLYRLLRRYEYVPIHALASKLEMKADTTRKILEYLMNMELIESRKRDYEGYKLTWCGLDTLALHKLRNLIELKEISHRINVGKEADIYACRGIDGRLYIVKTYRLGRTSFSKVKAKRPIYETTAGWLVMSSKAAKREFQILTKLWEVGVSVPKPIAHAYHMILMEFVPGRELYKARLKNPLSVFRTIINETLKAYTKAEIVHADLSEYNVIINEATEDIWIIDWSQWLPSDHLEAENYFRKDMENIVKFFHKKYRIDLNTLRGILEDTIRAFGKD